MKDEKFQAKLAEIGEKIHNLPEERRGPLMDLLAETSKRHEELKASFARTQAAIDNWRVAMKYLVFDREALRRERDDLRNMLGDQ